MRCQRVRVREHILQDWNAPWRLSPCHRAPQSDGKQLRLIRTGNPRSCRSQAAWLMPTFWILSVYGTETGQGRQDMIMNRSSTEGSEHTAFENLWLLQNSSTYIRNACIIIHIIPTFMANPDGMVFLGHSNSVEWIRIPDSISSTALVSGLKHKNYQSSSWFLKALKRLSRVCWRCYGVRATTQ